MFVTINPDGIVTFRQADIMACLEEIVQENKQIREERDRALKLAHDAIQAERNAREERNEVLLFMARLAEKAKP